MVFCHDMECMILQCYDILLSCFFLQSSEDNFLLRAVSCPQQRYIHDNRTQGPTCTYSKAYCNKHPPFSFPHSASLVSSAALHFIQGFMTAFYLLLLALFNDSHLSAGGDSYNSAAKMVKRDFLKQALALICQTRYI